MEKQWHITIEEKLAIDMQDSLGYKFDSNFEVKMAVTLNFLNIPFSFKATKFYFVAGEKAIAFTPDFVLDMYYEDKRVIIDTHGSQFTKQRPISKMHNFMQSDYSNNYYFILVTDRIPGKPSRFKRKLKELGYRQGRDLNPKAREGTGLPVAPFASFNQLLTFYKLKTGALPDSATLAY